jgi:hypothetical protein
MAQLTDLTAVRKALAAAAQTIAGPPKLRAQHYAPTGVINTPLFAVGEMSNDFDQAMARGVDEWLFTGRLYAAPQGDGRAASELLDKYLAPLSAMSIKKALEVDRTLGGTCATLRVERIHGYAVYTIGQDAYIGARFDIRVW